MPKKVFRQNSLVGGINPATFYQLENGYTAGLGIDPDIPTIGNAFVTSEAINASNYSKFSGTEIASNPMWIVTNPKTDNAYVYTTGGKIHSFNLQTAIPTMRATEGILNFPLSVTNGNGNGFCYYNNYIYGVQYGATGDLNSTAKADLFRYGPLDGTPALTLNVFTGTTLGSQPALTNVAYPTSYGPALPNHVCYVHKDAMYVCDYVGGQGVLHRVATKANGTNEGELNDGTASNVIDLPYGYKPTCIASWGIDLVIGAVQTKGNDVNGGRAAVFFWEIGSDSFYRMVQLPDVFVTALAQYNGTLYAFSGSSSFGARISKYSDGETFRDVTYVEQSFAPLAGGVEFYGGRIYWGGFTAYPTGAAAVFSYGSKHPKIPKALHCPIRASVTTGSNPVVLCLKQFQQSSGLTPRLITGWGAGSVFGLDRQGGNISPAAIFLTETFNVGSKFDVVKVKLELDSAVSATTEIQPTIIIDNVDEYPLTLINGTNFLGKKTIYYKAPFTTKMTGRRNVALKLSLSGQDYNSVVFPIEITVDEHGDEE
jgi:hypothetical protein